MQSVIAAYLLTDVIAAYISAREKRAGIRTLGLRLGPMYTYLVENGLQTTRCDDVDDEWVNEFREWNIVSVDVGNGQTRERSRPAFDNWQP